MDKQQLENAFTKIFLKKIAKTYLAKVVVGLKKNK
jgi:hypothetical protein